MPSKDHPLRRKRMVFSMMMVAVLLIAGALSYFLLTGRKPHAVVPVLGLNKPDYLFSIYGKEKIGQFRNPSGVAIDENTQTLYVVDRLNYRIVATDLDGNAVFTIKEPGKGKRFINPIYIDVDSKGQIYVTDTGVAGMYVFDNKGKFIKNFEPKDKNGKKMGWVPLGMDFDKDDNLYVADKGLHRILKFNKDGKLLLSFGKLKQISKVNSGGSFFYFPNDVALSPNGDIYVSDSNNYRLQVFDKNGKFKKVVGVGGVPRGLAWLEGGPSSGLYTVNVIDQKVAVYTNDGSFRFDFGEGGEEDGQFGYPNDIAINDERVYVADTENNRIQVWAF